MSGLPLWNDADTQPGVAVKAIGSAAAAATLAPFTRRECAFFLVELREWENGVLYPFLTVVSRAPFYVCTESAKVLFDPSRCEAHVKGGVATGQSVDYPSETFEFLVSHGHAGEPRLSFPPMYARGRRSFHWKESIVLSGDQVRVAGTLTSRVDITGRSTYREPPTLPSIGHPGAVLIDDA
jgi:hypothetical protein